jgi:hypothetical protein
MAKIIHVAYSTDEFFYERSYVLALNTVFEQFSIQFFFQNVMFNESCIAVLVVPTSISKITCGERPARNMISVSAPCFGDELFNSATFEKIQRAVLSKFKMADVKTEIHLVHRIQGVVLRI